MRSPRHSPEFSLCLRQTHPWARIGSGRWNLQLSEVLAACVLRCWDCWDTKSKIDPASLGQPTMPVKKCSVQISCSFFWRTLSLYSTDLFSHTTRHVIRLQPWPT